MGLIGCMSANFPIVDKIMSIDIVEFSAHREHRGYARVGWAGRAWKWSGTGCGKLEPVSMGDIETVAVTDLPDDFTGDAERILLDVREDDEWELAHVAGALHIPLGEVPARIDEIDLDRELLVVCRTSGRSYRIMEYLLMRGIDGAVVSGGMVAWEAAGKPTESGPGDA